MCYLCRIEKSNRRTEKLSFLEQRLKEEFFQLLETKGPAYMQALFDKKNHDTLQKRQ